MKTKITKDAFERYEDVRQSGRTNMFHVENVMALSGLKKAQCFEIMKNYLVLKKEFMEVKP